MFIPEWTSIAMGNGIDELKKKATYVTTDADKDGIYNACLHYGWIKERYLLALDMDGTLLNSEKKISNKTVEAINKAIEAGKTVILNTGRCPAELKEYRDVLPRLRYVNCVSGALVYDYEEEKKYL